MQKLEFFVRGQPATQGSKKAFYNPKAGRALVVEDCKKNRPWRSDVRNEAEKAIDAQRWELFNGPVFIHLTFCLPRPKGDFNSKGLLKPSAPKFHTKKPDTVKLARAVEDALKGVVWGDDSQICQEFIEKIYGDQPGVRVEIQTLEE